MHGACYGIQGNCVLYSLKAKSIFLKYSQYWAAGASVCPESLLQKTALLS